MKCGKCKRPSTLSPGRRFCDDCNAGHRKNGASPYTPLDVVLDKATTRILRSLRHFDSVAACDLMEVLDVPDCRTARSQYYNAFERLMLNELVRRDQGKYWITQEWRGELARRLTTSVECEE